MEPTALCDNVNAYALGGPKQPSLTERRGANVPTCTTHPKFEKERFFFARPGTQKIEDFCASVSWGGMNLVNWLIKNCDVQG